MDPSEGPTWTQAFFVLGALTILVTAGIIVVWQAFVTWRSRMSIAREEAYRHLAEQVTQAQTKTSECLEKATSELSDLRQRMAEVERILKEVD
jgi:type VI protein secretion system component VasK